MTTANAVRVHNGTLVNSIVHGDCIQVMCQLPAQSVDLILTDPPYLVNFRDRAGRSIPNDRDDSWLKPAFTEAFRILKTNRFMICFYGWSRIDSFLQAWREAGFHPVGHLVFAKDYASRTTFLRYQHEQAFLLAKGHPNAPAAPISDVREFRYSRNKLHPTQKPVSSLIPLIESFSRTGDLVADPFCGSASTCAAALLTGRHFIGIELDEAYHRIAVDRMARIRNRIAAQRLLPKRE
ncbi:MAG TPA: DNA methyltransferase [Terriglobales bacterium]|nr:DNA methyltransferase [Terriglobales bacterium]